MIDKLWSYGLCPVWSFVLNCLYWLVRLHRLKSALEEKKAIQSTTTDLAGVKKQIDYVSYLPDHYKDWQQWVVTLIDKGFYGDCEDAANFGKFLFKSAGIESKVLQLRGKAGGHAVCVSQGQEYMITNNQFIKLNGVDPLKYFTPDYDIIL